MPLADQDVGLRHLSGNSSPLISNPWSMPVVPSTALHQRLLQVRQQLGIRPPVLLMAKPPPPPPPPVVVVVQEKVEKPELLVDPLPPSPPPPLPPSREMPPPASVQQHPRVKRRSRAPRCPPPAAATSSASSPAAAVAGELASSSTTLATTTITTPRVAKPRPCHACRMAQKAGQAIPPEHVCLSNALTKPRKRTNSVMTATQQLDHAIRNVNQLSKFEYDFYLELEKFYKDTTYIETMIIPLVTKKDKRMPIRLINWLASGYTLCTPDTLAKVDIAYEVTYDGKLIETQEERMEWQSTQPEEHRNRITPFNLEKSYEAALQEYTKDFFDAFRRGPLTAIPLKNGDTLITTLAQLCFMAWAIRWLVLEYAKRHRDDIYGHMLKFQPRRGKGESASRRRSRALSSKPGSSSLVEEDSGAEEDEIGDMDTTVDAKRVRTQSAPPSAAAESGEENDVVMKPSASALASSSFEEKRVLVAGPALVPVGDSLPSKNDKKPVSAPTTRAAYMLTLSSAALLPESPKLFTPPPPSSPPARRRRRHRVSQLATSLASSSLIASTALPPSAAARQQDHQEDKLALPETDVSMDTEPSTAAVVVSEPSAVGSSSTPSQRRRKLTRSVPDGQFWLSNAQTIPGPEWPSVRVP